MLASPASLAGASTSGLPMLASTSRTSAPGPPSEKGPLAASGASSGGASAVERDHPESGATPDDAPAATAGGEGAPPHAGAGRRRHAMGRLTWHPSRETPAR